MTWSCWWFSWGHFLRHLSSVSYRSHEEMNSCYWITRLVLVENPRKLVTLTSCQYITKIQLKTGVNPNTVFSPSNFLFMIAKVCTIICMKSFADMLKVCERCRLTSINQYDLPSLSLPTGWCLILPFSPSTPLTSLLNLSLYSNWSSHKF